jgi:type IV secretory pathway VirD2 relaxase
MRDDDHDFALRPGKIRSRGARPKSFFNEVLRAVSKQTGGRPTIGVTGKSIASSRSTFGRGRGAYGRSLFSASSRRVAIKARIARHQGRSFRPAAMAKHLAYLQREGVTKDSARALMFDAGGDTADENAFIERCADDRHHFRFIVSPEDAAGMMDLRAFTRDLARQMETDLGTKLDWVAIDHWNTDNPHIHLLVRGVDDTGADLVIARDYIARGMRSRAADLVTRELGPKPEHEIRAMLEREATADRWTRLDREIAASVDAGGLLDLRPGRPGPEDPFLRRQMIRRLQYLETMGLAATDGAGQWVVGPEAEGRLRELGLRGDIVKTMHRALTERGLDRAVEDYVIDAPRDMPPIVGRLVATGLHDELSGEAFAIVDGVDGRAHHLRFRDVEAFDYAPPPGGIVELRRFGDSGDPKPTLILANRSDLDLTRQVTAPGATWLDRRLVERTPLNLAASGFGLEVQRALRRRAEHLIGEGLAQRDADRVRFRKNLLDTLRNRELEAIGNELAQTRGMTFHPAAPGGGVSGTFRETIRLSSGRFAMIGDGLGFQLVPWSASLERFRDRQLSGIVRDDGGVDWRLERTRGISR